MARKSEINRGRGLLCGKKCHGLFLGIKFKGQARPIGSGKPEYTLDTADKWFWPSVDRSGGMDSCWPWTGNIDDHGYGSIKAGRLKLRRAHQIAFALHNGARAIGLVCHICNFKPCCNGNHLYDGTHLTNTRDRQAAGVYIGSRGEANAQVKLSNAEVIAIRQSTEPSSIIAKRFIVSRQLIWLIRTRRAWKHLEMA